MIILELDEISGYLFYLLKQSAWLDITLLLPISDSRYDGLLNKIFQVFEYICIDELQVLKENHLYILHTDVKAHTECHTSLLRSLVRASRYLGSVMSISLALLTR